MLLSGSARCYSMDSETVNNEREFSEAEIRRIMALPPDRQIEEIYQLITEILREVKPGDIPQLRHLVAEIKDNGTTISGALDVIDGHVELRRILGDVP
jgi:hypothetical protein